MIPLAEHRERRRVADRRYAAAHRQQARARALASHARHRERHLREWKEMRELVRATVIQLLGGRCMRCNGRKSAARLEVHHINGDGPEHERRSGYTGVYLDLLAGRYPTADVELLCSSCHRQHHGNNR